MKFGFELLQEQIGERARQLVEERASRAIYEKDQAGYAQLVWGDSEIEKLFFLSLKLLIQEGRWLYENFRYAENHETPPFGLGEDADNPFEPEPQLTIVLQRQVDVGEWRVDFVIWALEWKASNPSWRSLIVECDGHDFHERTKDQAARDRARDRWATLNGRDLLRFTGSELWRDPLACADQVLEWAQR